MCFIISILMLVFSFNFFNAGAYLLSGGSLLVAILFIFLMIRNIKRVKRLREKKE